MNYFEFYDIPISFSPDQTLVKKKFYAFSKTYHPDFYINESEAKQNEILELSTVNNKAYQVLSDENKRIAYVLQLLGELPDGEKYNLSNDFLMDMMEINEALMEMEFEPDQDKLSSITSEVESVKTSLNDEFKKNINDYDLVTEEDKPQVLARIKDIYFRKKYLLRIQESIDTFATRL